MAQFKTAGSAWRRNAVAAAAGLCLATVVYAQQSSGSISGRAAGASTVSIENSSIGISRQIRADADGSFQIGQLPGGTYTVTVTKADGSKQTRQVVVSAGEGAVANFDDAQRVVVTGSAIRTLDVKSTESSQILSKSQIDRIPVIKDVTAVALLAPGAVVGDGRIGLTGTRSGNVPSLGGASPAENAYYINSFNVTNIVNGVAFNQIPFEGIAESQVKTGGYGAEFGRSLGGVINITTKRGTDEWHGGANLILEPRSFKGSSLRALKVGNDWTLVERPGDSTNMPGRDTKFNIWGGGPLVKDTLYGFALIQAAKVEQDLYGVSQQSQTKNTTPQYLAKLDWNINKSNLLEFTSFSDKSKDKVHTYTQVSQYGTARKADLGESVFENGGTNNILKWTGWLTDDFTLSALAGRGEYSRSSQVAGGDCPVVQDQRVAPVLTPGCSTVTSITDPNAGDIRDAFRLDAEYVLGKHTIRAGLDHELYKVTDGTVYPGTSSYLVQSLAAGGTLDNGYVNNSGSAIDYVAVRTFANGGKFKTKNSAWYIEDSFQVTKDVLLNLGIRNESFTNYNGNGDAFVKVTNTWAPRFGASWDVTGNADLKVYANAGRYYIPIYANTNARLASAETDYTDYFAFAGQFGADRKSIPVLGAQLGTRNDVSNGVVPDPRSVVDPNLKPMFQDEFILGFQKQLQDRWSAGVKYTHRALKSAMDDICGGDQARAWALANGYSANDATALYDAVNHCFLYNVGKDLTVNIPLEADQVLNPGKLTAVRVPASALLIPKPKRTYDALEFTLERAWDKKWSLSASYVLAFSKGNTEGYVKSDIGQDDAGISQDFDFPGLAEYSNGYLPNDRRHTFKAFGSYAVNDEVRVGANWLAQSGRPLNCFGYYAGTVDAPQTLTYGSSSFYCGGKPSPRGSRGRLPWTHQLDVQVSFTPAAVKGLTFTVDWLNVLDHRTVRAVLERGETALNTPRAAYLQPELNTLQKPSAVRFTAQYEF